MDNKPGTYFVVSSYPYEDSGFTTAGRGGGRAGTLVLVRRLAGEGLAIGQPGARMGSSRLIVGGKITEQLMVAVRLSSGRCD